MSIQRLKVLYSEIIFLEKEIGKNYFKIIKIEDVNSYLFFHFLNKIKKAVLKIEKLRFKLYEDKKRR